jgi:hypothetical protein
MATLDGSNLPAPSPSGAGASDDESVTNATFTEIFGAITLANPTWTILRHPRSFARYRTNPGAAIHYLYSATAVTLLIEKWTSSSTGNDGGDAAPVVALINRAIRWIGPNAKIEGDDAIPVMLLIGNIVAGFTAYYFCRWLTRRRGDAGRSNDAASQTLAATAYLGGACAIIFAIGTLFARGDPDAWPSEAAGFVLLVLVYFWGTWIRKIHDVIPGKFLGFMFPYLISFASLAIFAGLVEIVKLILS